MFRTQYTSHDRFFTNAGSRDKILYTSRYDEIGNLELVEVGVDSLYDFIQSHKDSVDINVLLSRFSRGDVDALSRKQGVFGDFTAVPRNYADMLNLVIDAENNFNSLPVDERAKFHHNFAEWLFNLDKISASEAKQSVANVEQAGKLAESEVIE